MMAFASFKINDIIDVQLKRLLFIFFVFNGKEYLVEIKRHE